MCESPVSGMFWRNTGANDSTGAADLLCSLQRSLRFAIRHTSGKAPADLQFAASVKEYLGHVEQNWDDPRFQQMYVGAIKWAMGLAEADLTPRPLQVQSGNAQDDDLKSNPQ
jgi:hypothetical protein